MAESKFSARRYLEWVHNTHGAWIKHEQRYEDGTKPGEAMAEYAMMQEKNSDG